MYLRKRTARRRWSLVIGSLLALVVLGLSWWQGYARRHGAYSPAEQALIAVLSPSARIAARVRGSLTAETPYAMDSTHQLPRTGMDRLTELEIENRQLKALLGLRNSLPTGAIAAEVIGRSVNPWQGTLTLGSGKAEGVQPHMVALTPDGVLGQVVKVAEHQAEVLLITDRAAGMGGMIARTRETGVLKGLKNGQCQLIYLANTAVVQVGDEVVTSGQSDYFPKGLPLGSIVSVDDDPSLSSRTAIVAPATNPATVEFVVLTQNLQGRPIEPPLPR